MSLEERGFYEYDHIPPVLGRIRNAEEREKLKPLRENDNNFLT